MTIPHKREEKETLDDRLNHLIQDAHEYCINNIYDPKKKKVGNNKSRPRFSKVQTVELENFYQKYKDQVRGESQELKKLSQKLCLDTGLTQAQIDNWVVNRQQRTK